MVDYLSIIAKYYKPGTDLYNLLILHSRQVAELAMWLADSASVAIDKEFVYEAAMLHDIGVILTDAPSIHCHGSEPYMRHGLIGKAMLEREGLPRHALVCERHVGTGLTAQEIATQGLPLPAVDMVPVTNEEKLVCYADNFFSKSKPTRGKTYTKLLVKTQRYGAAALARLEEMHALFPLASIE